MTAKPQKLTPDTLRKLADILASKGRLPTAGSLRAHANSWEGTLADLDAAHGKQVSGFYAEEHPQFRQGEPAHELEELVTAEDCTSMVRAIVSMQEDVRALLVALATFHLYNTDGEAVHYPVRIPVDIINKVRKRVDLPEIK